MSQTPPPTKVKNFTISETNTKINIEINLPKLKYLDFFIKLKCAPLLLQSGFYPNVKELSETIGVFDQAKYHFNLHHQNENIMALMVGDGQYPRCGLYAAAMTKWNIISIDPAMKDSFEKISEYIKPFSSFKIIPDYIENIEIPVPENIEYIILYFVHSHASLKATLKALKTKKDISINAISLPCCQDDDLGIPCHHEFLDFEILSVHKKIQIYKNIELLKC